MGNTNDTKRHRASVRLAWHPGEHLDSLHERRPEEHTHQRVDNHLALQGRRKGTSNTNGTTVHQGSLWASAAPIVQFSQQRKRRAVSQHIHSTNAAAVIKRGVNCAGALHHDRLHWAQHCMQCSSEPDCGLLCVVQTAFGRVVECGRVNCA